MFNAKDWKESQILPNTKKLARMKIIKISNYKENSNQKATKPWGHSTFYLNSRCDVTKICY